MSRWLVGLSFLAVALFTGPGHRSAEQVRLRAHFDSVLVELQARDVSMLSASQRTARGTLVRWLAEYRAAGQFPLNDRYSDLPTPIFRDAHGAMCAMAYLIERSGRRDMVDQIAATRNLAYVRELADDTAVVAWLDKVGFSLAEAARVQPEYPDPLEGRVYSGMTVVLSGTSLATTAWNVFKPSKAVGFVSMIVGGATVFIGLSMPEGHQPLPTINLVSGGLAFLTGIYAAEKPRNPKAPEVKSSNTRRVEWSPLLEVGRTGTTRVGLLARF